MPISCFCAFDFKKIFSLSLFEPLLKTSRLTVARKQNKTEKRNYISTKQRASRKNENIEISHPPTALKENKLPLTFIGLIYILLETVLWLLRKEKD